MTVSINLPLSEGGKEAADLPKKMNPMLVPRPIANPMKWMIKNISLMIFWLNWNKGMQFVSAEI